MLWQKWTTSIHLSALIVTAMSLAPKRLQAVKPNIVDTVPIVELMCRIYVVTISLQIDATVRAISFFARGNILARGVL